MNAVRVRSGKVKRLLHDAPSAEGRENDQEFHWLAIAEELLHLAEAATRAG